MAEKSELNFLIIDDSLSTRVVYRHYLKSDEKYNVNIFEAQNANQGLKILDTEKVDCLLLDYCLPDMVGSTVVEQIRKDNRFKFLPIIVFTGYGTEEVAVESMKKGANDYLVKGSVNKEKFLNTIHLAIEQCDANKEKITIQKKMANISKLVSIGVLTSGVAHELNNPLAGIIGLTETIISDPCNREKVVDKANKIIVASKRIKKIIDQLRQFSRDSYSTKNWRQINLNVIIKRVYSTFFDVFKEKDIKIFLDLDEQIPFIWGDSKQVEIIISNLIANSIDAFDSNEHDGSTNSEGNSEGNKNKFIKTVTYTYNEGVKIIIEDNAGGMSSHVEEHAFDPFFTTKDVGKGTGLGLSVVYGIVEKLQGTVSLLNREKFGVRFEMWFPEILLDNESDDSNKKTDADSDDASKIKNKTSKKASVMIIDDEEVICEILSDFLKDEFDVTVLTKPEEALKKIEECKFDLIVTDYNMPKVNGVDILFAAKAAQPATPVIVISGHAREEVEMKSVLEKGAKEILSKPFVSMDEVLNVLKHSLNR
ncbi:MAG: response regulator [Oligoflexia bacterium]|nr:response regulator [Oligoflexia bacterium]